MTGRRWLADALAVVASAAVTGSALAADLAATRVLAERLTRAGRAEARFVQNVAVGAETLSTDRGRLALELPDRLRLDFASSGERLTVRGDGGEWLQPSAQQLLVLRADQAAAAAGLWQVLLSAGGEAFAERPLGGRRFALVARARDGSLPDSLGVRLGTDGLPSGIEAWTGDQRWSLALAGWRFAPPRGARAFVLRAPAGYAVVEWP